MLNNGAILTWRTDESAFIFSAESLSSHITIGGEVEQRISQQAAGRQRSAVGEKAVFMAKQKQKVKCYVGILCVMIERER